MPDYLLMSRIDWHYEKAAPDLQEYLRHASSSLSADHTLQTFEEHFCKMAAERPDLVADALVEDGFRRYSLYRAREGKVTAVEVEQRPEGALDRSVDLPLDEIATVMLVRQHEEIESMLEAVDNFGGCEDGELDLPVRYEDESSMRELFDRVARAIDQGEHRFVADVGVERFLVEIRPGAASVRKLVVVTEPDLVARLLLWQYADVPEPPPRGNEKRVQAL